MASATSVFPALTHVRGRLFFLPREHGAWGMLLVPLLTGAAAGNPHGERVVWVLLFAAAALGLFCLRTPVEATLEISALRPQNDRERRLSHYSIYLYASVSCLALAGLLLWARAYGLLLLGAAAAMIFLIQSILKRLGRETRMSAQSIGAMALSTTSVGAYYLATGRFGSMALIIWLANWLFAANQIHFVQLRIHSARPLMAAKKFRQGRSFLLHEALSLALLGLLWRAGWLPGLILVAFAPLIIRGFAWFLESPRPLRVHRLGVSELLYAIIFGMFFIVGFHHPLG
jgi:YwiC-like protein